MDCILTLVSSDKERPLLSRHLLEVEQCLPMKIGRIHWLSPNKAADVHLSAWPDRGVCQQLESQLAKDRLDFFIVPDDQTRRKMLLIADMDNTMVVGETIDELAAQCGLKGKIAAITDQAMRGELDFQTALRRRVAMLENLPEEALRITLAAIQPMPGAELLVTVMRRHGARCVLASGGFTFFTQAVAAKLGFQVSHGNTLEIRAGRLTGKVCEPILDHHSKRSFLDYYREKYGLDVGQTLAVGDGANDLDMISAAGLGVGYHPKPYLKERVANNIIHGDLTALLYAQGYENF